MPIVYARPVFGDFRPKPLFPCFMHPRVFIDKLYFWFYNKYGVSYHNISWLAEDALAIYHQVVVLRRVINVECEFEDPRFVRKRVKLQVSIEFDVTV
ncbi:hypothetical protein MKW98_005381, partial [Papaver atlanticum]